MKARAHGGADAFGAPRWDFSTCSNGAGPCPQALAAVRAADPTRYPDPACSALRQALARLHGVAPTRVLPAASASEFIQRMTAVSARLWPGPVALPRHGFGDYAAAARAWGRRVDGDAASVTLRWCADPCSPLGQALPPPEQPGRCPTVLDAVYAPLRLHGDGAWRTQAMDAVFVLHSPGKALGLTGVRGAYAIAPRHAGYDLAALCRALEQAAPSWPLSAQADALLQAWAQPAVQAWVAASLPRLGHWKAALQQQLQRRGFDLLPSLTPYFVLRPPPGLRAEQLRARGVAVRDTASFGLPGCWRVSAQPAPAQRALLAAVDACLEPAR